MSYPSISLAIWANAWLAGKATPDDVIDALHSWAPIHHLKLSDPVTADSTLPLDGVHNAASVLQALRRLTQGCTTIKIQVVLPVPGDVQGIPAGTDFSKAAMEAGEALVISGTGLNTTALVPYFEQEDVLIWTIFPLPSPISAHSDMSLGEVEWALKKAISEAADAIMQIELLTSQNSVTDARSLIQDAILERSTLQLPDSSPRALRVLDSATQIEAILLVSAELASTQNLSGNHILEQTLLPLWTLVRTARVAATQTIIAEAWKN